MHNEYNVYKGKIYLYTNVYKEYKIDLPMPSDYRNVVSTDPSDLLKDEVARHLGHSTETSRRCLQDCLSRQCCKSTWNYQKMVNKKW